MGALVVGLTFDFLDKATCVFDNLQPTVPSAL